MGSGLLDRWDDHIPWPDPAGACSGGARQREPALSQYRTLVPGGDYAVVLAMASFERTSTCGASGLCGWGRAARVKSAVAPGRKTRQ